VNHLTTSISGENYLKLQILLKKPVSDFDDGLSELLENYEKFEKRKKENKKVEFHKFYGQNRFVNIMVKSS